MSAEDHSPRLPTPKRARKRRGLSSRRKLLAWFASLVAGGALLRRGVQGGIGTPQPAIRVEVTQRCVGCTACAIVCPTDAIRITPGGIRVVQEDCISCGYCQAGCTVDGIRVLAEAPRG
jgi:ferredoxin